jgi:hypothetical protein
MRYIIYMLVFITLLACHNAKKATDKNTTIPISVNNVKSMEVDTNYRFSVSFISIGAGIDRKAKQEYDQFIVDFDQKNNVKLNYEVTSWGREGEVDYCFKLTELNKVQKDQFVAKSKETIKSSTLIRFRENMPCKEKRK